MKIFHPIEKQHRRETQWFGENFIWRGKPMYGIGGHIPAWRYHMGIDYSSRENGSGGVMPLPIRAGIDGKLKMMTTNGKGMECQIIGEEYMCQYIHLSRFENEQERYVHAGEVIGYTGNTGTFTTAAHLHMGVAKVREDGSRIKTGLDLGWLDFSDMLTDDLISARVASYRKEIRGIPIIHKAQPESSSGLNGMYNPYKRYIVLYPNFFNRPHIQQEALLEHEWMHSIYFDLPGNNVLKGKPNTGMCKLWDDISKFDKDIVARISKLTGQNYTENKYISDYAYQKRQFPSEDLSEMWEYHVEQKLLGNTYTFEKDNWLYIKKIFALYIRKTYGTYP